MQFIRWSCPHVHTSQQSYNDHVFHPNINVVYVNVMYYELVTDEHDYIVAENSD